MSKVKDRPSGFIACCAHHKPSTLGYLEWHHWAEGRSAKGEQQTQCPTCKLWLFPEEFGKEPRS